VSNLRVSDQIKMTQTLRFSSATGGRIQVTYANLLDAWLVAVGAATAYDIFDMIRVLSVKLEVMAGAENAVSTAIISFPGKSTAGLFGDGASYQADGIGTSVPAVCTARPSKNSTVGQFQTSTSNVAFVLESRSDQTAGSFHTLVEVIAEFRNNADIIPTPAAAAAVGAAPGEMYFRGLDGQNAGATLWPSLFAPRA